MSAVGRQQVLGKAIPVPTRLNDHDWFLSESVSPMIETRLTLQHWLWPVAPPNSKSPVRPCHPAGSTSVPIQTTTLDSRSLDTRQTVAVGSLVTRLLFCNCYNHPETENWACHFEPTWEVSRF